MLFNFVVLMLCGFLSVNLVQSETYTIDEKTGIIAISDKKCTELGPLCSDCSTLSYCIQLGNGSWSMQTISKCSNGDTCNSVSFECSSAPNYECDSATSPNSFVCHGVGLFPDPFICEKYHMCVPGEEDPSIPQETSIVLSCPSGYGYDVVTSSCRIKKEACPSAIICTNSTMKAFVKNPSFYYWCLKTSSSAYYPHIFMCPQGQHMINNRCQDPPTGILTSGYCLSPGNYADPSNCRAYNECPAKDVVAIKRICPNTQYFSYVSGKCVDFTCNSFIGK